MTHLRLDRCSATCKPATARYVLVGVLMALAGVFAGVAPASAQITTGVVSGAVGDDQGAVIPGATVTLISDTRGTRVADVQTSQNGDFVFPNVPGDTYTVQVTLAGFKTLRRPGVVVSPGDRVAVPTLTLSVGTLDETVNVRAEGADDPGAERRAVVHGDDGVGREPADRQPQLRGLCRAGARRHRADRDGDCRRGDAPRRRRPEQHHDGRRLDHGHRQQRPAAADERRRRSPR